MPVLTFYIVTLTSIISFIFYKKIRNTKYIYFTYYLFFVFLIELFAFIIGKVFYLNNYPIYNLYILITPIFYLSFYYSIFKSKKSKKTIKFFLLIYIIFSLIEVFRNNFIENFYSNNLVFGSILITITLILFLIEIINNENIVFNLTKSLIFWISIGSLLFFIGSIPIVISSKYLNFDGIYDIILTVLNIVMYGSFIIGFIKSDPKYNY